MSCVYRIHQKSGFDLGINHLIAVLTGGMTDKIRQHGHDSLSTYGIGREHTRAEWAGIVRQLIRMSLLVQSTDRFVTVGLTPMGLAFLRERRSISLSRPIPKRLLTAAAASGAEDESEDETAFAPEVASQGTRKRRGKGKQRTVGLLPQSEPIFEALRALRKRLATERGVPPYIVFGDATLRLMAIAQPQTQDELLRISGVGEKKLRDYGAAFLAVLRRYPPSDR